MEIVKHLNKRGSRFITVINGKRKTHMFKTLGGKRVQRTLLEERDLGVFGWAKIRWNGQVIGVLLDSILID